MDGVFQHGTPGTIPSTPIKFTIDLLPSHLSTTQTLPNSIPKFFTISSQHKNGNITNFVLPVPFKI